MSASKVEEVLRRAGSLESQSPRAALREYERALKLNGATYPALFRAGMVFPLIATLLAYFLRPLLGPSSCIGWLLPFALLYFVGYLPVFGIHRSVIDQTRFRYVKLKDPGGRAQTVLIASFMVMANDWFALLGIAFFGFLIAFPFIGILSLATGYPLSGLAY